jgi:hypothetical protein
MGSATKKQIFLNQINDKANCQINFVTIRQIFMSKRFLTIFKFSNRLWYKKNGFFLNQICHIKQIVKSILLQKANPQLKVITKIKFSNGFCDKKSNIFKSN